MDIVEALKDLAIVIDYQQANAGKKLKSTECLDVFHYVFDNKEKDYGKCDNGKEKHEFLIRIGYLFFAFWVFEEYGIKFLYYFLHDPVFVQIYNSFR